MIEASISRLEELARADPVVAPLVVLQAEALRASADAIWEAGVPEFEDRRLDASQPLLNNQVAYVEADSVQHLIDRLAAMAGQSGQKDPEPLRRALMTGALDPLAVLQASVVQDSGQLEMLAAEAGADTPLLGTLGQLAALPLLLACGRKGEPLVAELHWLHGYCPVCAAWPTLAESRGLERRRWLRCGRCGTAWSVDQQFCPFCTGRDHRLLGYLAAEGQTESRRASTCDGCRGYLKSVATIAAIPAEEIVLRDLQTLELDLAAIDQGYARPEVPGFSLQIRIEPANQRMSRSASR